MKRLLLVFVSGMLVLGLLGGTVKVQATGMPIRIRAYDQYGVSIPATFDVTGPAGWHRTGKTDYYPHDLYTAYGPVSTDPDPTARSYYYGTDCGPEGIYTCTCTYRGEVQTQTQEVTSNYPPNEQPNGSFGFVFGKYLLPTQTDANTYEWGFVPSYTSETVDGAVGHDYSVKVDEFIVFRNLTAYFDATELETNYGGRYTRSWWESNIVHYFIDGVIWMYDINRGDEFGVGGNGGGDFLDHVYYVKAHYDGIHYVDSRPWRLGYHGTITFDYVGNAYVVVLDEIVVRGGKFGMWGINYGATSSGGIQPKAQGNSGGFDMAEFEDEEWSNPDFFLLNLNTGPKIPGEALGQASSCYFDWSQIHSLIGVSVVDGDFWTNTAMLPVNLNRESGSVIDIPPVIYLPLIGDVPTVAVAVGGVSIILVAVAVIVLVRKRLV